VTVREADQSSIYGDYICRAENNYGEAESIIEMIRARMNCIVNPIINNNFRIFNISSCHRRSMTYRHSMNGCYYRNRI